MVEREELAEEAMKAGSFCFFFLKNSMEKLGGGCWEGSPPSEGGGCWVLLEGSKVEKTLAGGWPLIFF